jgi:BioD-like phosphotransacetylase family protein
LSFSKEGEQLAGRQQPQNIDEVIILEDEEGDEEEQQKQEEEEQRQQAERIDIVIEEVIANAQVEEQERERGRSKEIEVIEIIEEDEEPLRKITKMLKGHKREYFYLQTVKSMEELDRTRLTVMCKHKCVSTGIAANFHFRITASLFKENH